jgi:hypothetical protein
MKTTYEPKPQTIKDIVRIEKIVGRDGVSRNLIQSSHPDGLEHHETGTSSKLRNILKGGYSSERGIIYFQHERSVEFGTKSISYTYIE